MSKEILMPRLGENMEEGYIVEWLKGEGEEVEKGEPLFRVETDKAVFDAESETTGTLEKILFAEGETVKVGKVIALLSEGE